ncbi:non-hydrolyzing UDP-N-acetylglucosamine 2-epimerase [Cellulosimicrobium sp. KWT-B]|uniref:non-hydrolyzing UDP-N-acetylglucosamine 2-epimerase n=1 Tax=Cellulosimicrobium sp. KWT-B TaxID=1981152 RepID=UPI000A3227AB|nr:UDP-N-acetylglucosamine 2-epimerase (non-hydrolyzing) [Cellulosimicrobium sp. KWT-B]
MKVMSIVGARPQFVKLAPVATAMAAHDDVEHVIVHTGQHYDPMLSDVFFRDLQIPSPDVHLEVGSAGHGKQTGAILARMDDVIAEQGPDWVLVYGDTNSTLAGALSAVKLGAPVAHLEAGLRSFNRRMPEEHNRVLTDHAADLCLAPTEVAMGHLRSEGLADRSELVGDVMTDVLHLVARRADHQPVVVADRGWHDGDYYVATIHRAENTDDVARLDFVLRALAGLDRPVLLLAHPRLVAKAASAGLELARGAIVPTAPLPYPELVAAVSRSAGVVTDSGGLQKEAFLLRVPCTTIRTETEWVETVELGWNVLANSESAVREAVLRPTPAATDATPYGDGAAAVRVVDALRRHAA